MEITYLGLSSFKIKGKNVTLITDPYKESQTGLKYPKIEADIITISHEHEGHSNHSAVSGNPLIVSGPGEYEIKGAKIFGVSTFHDLNKGESFGKNIVYKIEIDGISIVHLGDLGHKLTDNEKETIDNVDILLVPVGGVYTLNPSTAVEVVASLEPKVVIPMHYSKSALKQDPYGKLVSVTDFLKEMGKENTVAINKFNITKDRFPVELTVIVLE